MSPLIKHVSDDERKTADAALDAPPSVQRPLPAACALPLLGGILVFSLFTGRFLPFVLFASALVGGCAVYAFASRFRIGIEFQAPSRITEGDSIELTFLVKSRARLPRFVASSVVEAVYPGRPNEDAVRRERHRLFYRQSEAKRGRPRESSDTETYQMDGFFLFRGVSRVHRQLQFDQRGVVRLHRMRVYFSDPLGFFAVRRSFKVDHDILVRLRPTLGVSHLRISGASSKLETHMTVGETGEMTEYAGTRPYRPGDELRHIHWPTVARTGDLYVREYTPSSAESIIVLLLRNPEHAGCRTAAAPPGGEAVLRTAAALVLELFERRVQTAFASNLGKGLSLNIGNAKLQLQRFHDSLSALSWAEGVTNSLGMLEHLEIVRSEPPTVLAFCLDPPSMSMLQDVSEILRIEHRRFSLVCPDTMPDRGRVPQRIRTVWLREDAPQELFQDLTL